MRKGTQRNEFVTHLFSALFRVLSNHRSELLQKTHIILKEKPDVFDLVFYHGGPFDADAESKTGIFFGVDVAIG